MHALMNNLVCKSVFAFGRVSRSGGYEHRAVVLNEQWQRMLGKKRLLCPLAFPHIFIMSHVYHILCSNYIFDNKKLLSERIIH